MTMLDEAVDRVGVMIVHYPSHNLLEFRANTPRTIGEHTECHLKRWD
jgi:hypothetical protein